MDHKKHSVPSLRNQKVLIAFFILIALSLLVINSYIFDPILNRIDKIQYQCNRRIYREPFDSRKWISHSDTRSEVWNVRMRMYEDLIRRKILIGKTKEQVQEILGPTDDINEDKGYILYSLGLDPELINVDKFDRLLVISFEGKHVISVSYTKDY